MGFNKDCYNLVSLKMSLSSSTNGLPNEMKMSLGIQQSCHYRGLYMEPMDYLMKWKGVSSIQHSWHHRDFNENCYNLVSLKMSLSNATNGLPNEIKMSFRYLTLLKLQWFE